MQEKTMEELQQCYRSRRNTTFVSTGLALAFAAVAISFPHFIDREAYRDGATDKVVNNIIDTQFADKRLQVAKEMKSFIASGGQDEKFSVELDVPPVSKGKKEMLSLIEQNIDDQIYVQQMAFGTLSAMFGIVTLFGLSCLRDDRKAMRELAQKNAPAATTGPKPD